MNRDTRTFVMGIFWVATGLYLANDIYQDGLNSFWSYFWFIAGLLVAGNGFHKINKTTD